MKRILAHAEARRRAHADIDQAGDDWTAETKPPTLDEMCRAAMERLAAWINRSVAQNKRRMLESWGQP